MDAKPSTSALFPPRKRSALGLGHLSLVEKQNILNMYKKLKAGTSTSKSNTTSIVSQIGDTLGIAKSTVYRVVKEYKNAGVLHNPKQSTGRTLLVKSFDEGDKTAIRQIVHSFYYRNELPTLDKIMVVLKSNERLPVMSRSTLYTLMKELNFKYMKRSRKSVLIERDDIICWRRKYLRQIETYRLEGRQIFYLDETWVNEGHTKAKVWVDQSVTSRRQAFLDGLSTGLKNPSGKGRRLIIVHIGTENGFVDDGLLVFEGKKTTDYHDEMNAAVFEEWFKKVLQKLPDKAVVVMDNASYHSRRCEKIPTSSSRKLIMQEWLTSKNIAFDEGMVRPELLQLIRMHKSEYNLYVTDEMAKSQNKTVLRLPPYHCELNPIELIWAQIKNEVASKNCTFKLNDIKTLLLKAVENVTNNNWDKCVKHVLKEEAKMKTLDGIVDTLVEPLIIAIGNESDSSSDSEMNLD